MCYTFFGAGNRKISLELTRKLSANKLLQGWKEQCRLLEKWYPRSYPVQVPVYYNNYLPVSMYPLTTVARLLREAINCSLEQIWGLLYRRDFVPDIINIIKKTWQRKPIAIFQKVTLVTSFLNIYAYAHRFVLLSNLDLRSFLLQS